MSNISPSKPSFTFGYWRPWKEDSNVIDSYLDYSKDVSLAKYGADTVGKYISQASKEQVDAVNDLAEKIGAGINIISDKMESGLIELSYISQELSFLNYNTNILIEQQKLSNLLLQDIRELLRVPDSEKERQLAIELGIKFFVNAQKDADLFDDSLEEFLKAESLMKQDYFVLHRIGMIYMHSAKNINIEKALEYFTRAAKYASVESDPKAMRLINILNNKAVVIEGIQDNELEESEQSKFDIIIKTNYILAHDFWLIIKRLTGLSFNEFNDKFGYIKSDYSPKGIGLSVNKVTAEEIKFELEVACDEPLGILSDERTPIILLELIKPIIPIIPTNEINVNEIKKLTADSFEKAAFAAYILGQFELAVVNQKKALEYKDSPENYFILSKYQARNKEISSCILNLEKAINDMPSLVLAVFKEIDLFNESDVLNLIKVKNKKIDDEIINIIDKFDNSETSNEINTLIIKLKELKNKSYEMKLSEIVPIKHLIEINEIIDEKIKCLIFEYEKIASDKTNGIVTILQGLKNEPYKTKVLKYAKYKNLDTIINDIKKTKKELDKLISSIGSYQFVNFPPSDIEALKLELIASKNGSLEEKKEMIKKISKVIENDWPLIGSKHFGGIVFYIDKANNYCLVASEKNYKKMVGGNPKVSWDFGTLTSIGSGYSNSVNILNHISTKKEFLFINKELMTAARFCLNLSVNNYSDWYLPSFDELTFLFMNIKNGEYEKGTYWTSSIQIAYLKSFDAIKHFQESTGKIDGLAACLVLPIRKQLL